jgi:septum formation protein
VVASRPVPGVTSRHDAFRLVLASRSPQRDALLRQLGIPFRVCVSAHDESFHDGGPAETVEQNARGKAAEVAARVRLAPGEHILGVDTVVVIAGETLGKAVDESQAAAWLRRLSGCTHEVYSGLCLRRGELERCGHEVTAVRFREIGADALEWYLASGEWRERAGAYAIQGLGSSFVASVSGDYFNVVGLPVRLLIDELASVGVAPLSWLSDTSDVSVGGDSRRSGTGRRV